MPAAVLSETSPGDGGARAGDRPAGQAPLDASEGGPTAEWATTSPPARNVDDREGRRALQRPPSTPSRPGGCAAPDATESTSGRSVPWCGPNGRPERSRCRGNQVVRTMVRLMRHRVVQPPTTVTERTASQTSGRFILTHELRRRLHAIVSATRTTVVTDSSQVAFPPALRRRVDQRVAARPVREGDAVSFDERRARADGDAGKDAAGVVGNQSGDGPPALRWMPIQQVEVPRCQNLG